MKAVEIICQNCNADTLLHREAIYDGFTKAGEALTCTSCGYQFEDESDICFKEQTKAPVIFTDADKSESLEIFDESENKQLCRYCANYIVNPFTQFCSVHNKEVQATDTCGRFKERVEKESDSTDLF